MVLRAGRRQGAGMGRVGGTVARFAIATVLLLGAASVPAFAQATLNESLASRTQAGSGKDRLLVEAKEIVYDDDKNTVSASGDAELSYQGRTLQADRVIYDRKTGRVFAEGNARMTEANGAVITGDRFELTEDFKNGFIDSLRVEQTIVQQGRPSKTRFSAPRAERIEGETTIFDRGTYTACEPCKEHPERPPLWQVKAARIIHDNNERTIYYENATLELSGIPVAYLPYFWTPDPTVKRKTGFLAPHYVVSSALGTGVSIPFFWAIAPNVDLTIQPTYLTRQGVLGQAEFRHRLDTGSYNIRAAGISQLDQHAFLPSPLGPRDRDFRGSLESAGRFNINERWRYGWDVALLSDRWFLNNYRIRSESIDKAFISESISTAYLQGQGDRSFFDLRGYYFQVLSSTDFQKQQPVVLPVLDYNKRVNGPQPLGGEVAVDLNFTSLTREATQFLGVQNNQAALFQFLNYDKLGNNLSLYGTCAVFQRGICLVPGLGGTQERLSTQISWRRQFIDSAGQVWTPFAYARADGIYYAPSTTNYQNAQIGNILGTEDQFVGRGMPAVGLEYRYPFVADAGVLGTHTVEPIAQVIARPSETRIGRLPNEDAQSLVFDDTTIFNWDKFSGYDRVEGGVRANVGAQYTVLTPSGFYGNALFGQSIHLAGVNSFRADDLVSVGRKSGLETPQSDYVGRLQVSPNQQMTFATRARFDQEDFAMKRLEVSATANLNPAIPLSTSISYARFTRQPELGYTHRREGLSAAASYNISRNWFVNGSVTYDLARYLTARENFTSAYKDYLVQSTYNPALSPPTYMRQGAFYPVIVGLGAGYTDECTTVSVNYSLAPQITATGTKDRVQTLLVRLELRTLGAVNVKPNIGPAATQDGIATATP